MVVVVVVVFIINPPTLYRSEQLQVESNPPIMARLPAVHCCT